MPGLRPPKEDIIKVLPLETEKKVLRATIIGTLLATLLIVISYATDYWLVLNVLKSHQMKSGNILLGSHSGLWRTCLDIKVNDTNDVISNCSNLFDLIEDVKKAKTQQNTIAGGPGVLLAYAKSYIAFAFISLIFVLLGHVFAVWAQSSQRYTVKRIAAVLFGLTAICILVAIQVLENSTESEEEYTEKIGQLTESDLEPSYGFSYVLAWISFAMFLIAALVFLITSKKRIGSSVDSDVYIS